MRDLTVNELATLSGLSIWALYKAVEQFRVPHVRRGKRIYFQVAELSTLLRNGETLEEDNLVFSWGG
jgi:hypothetical protein